MTAEDVPQTHKVKLTEAQRSITLGALVDLLADRSRYTAHSTIKDEPGPEDTCCDAHLRRYELRREEQASLRAFEREIRKTAKLFERPGDKLRDHID